MLCDWSSWMNSAICSARRQLTEAVFLTFSIPRTTKIGKREAARADSLTSIAVYRSQEELLKKSSVTRLAQRLQPASMTAFLFGLCPQPYQFLWRPFEGESESIKPFPALIDSDVWDARDEWVQRGITARVAEHALRVAYICACVDGPPQSSSCRTCARSRIR